MTKTCPKCKRILPLDGFHKSIDKKDGLRSHCKGCVRLYREAHKKEIASRRREYYENNKEKIKNKSRIYYDENKDKISQRAKDNINKIRDKRRAYREANREKVYEQDKNYRRKRRNKALIDQRNYYKAHREEICAYKRDRRAGNLNYRLSHSLRNRCIKALKGISKSNSTEALLGCTWEEARVYIERQFKPGMSWDNWGYNGWHIDHIIPISRFDLSDPEQQKTCFRYTNLQPLWRRDNQTKGSRITE